MITNFVTLSPGRIDFLDHGMAAMPTNRRRFTNELQASMRRGCRKQ